MSSKLAARVYGCKVLIDHIHGCSHTLILYNANPFDQCEGRTVSFQRDALPISISEFLYCPDYGLLFNMQMKQFQEAVNIFSSHGFANKDSDM